MEASVAYKAFPAVASAGSYFEVVMTAAFGFDSFEIDSWAVDSSAVGS